MYSGFKKPLRMAVFISGSGSTLQCFMEMHHQLEICLVVSNKADALGLLKAKRFGKNTIIISNPVDYEKLNQTLRVHRIERILLAGYMKLIPAAFVDQWQNRIVNIHPSLLPLYPGLRAAEKSWQDEKPMGVTLHQVNSHMDEGEILLQKQSLGAQAGVSSTFEMPELLLRRTEQHLLRELATRWN